MATTAIPANALTNPAAYGGVPVIPPTSTNSSTNTSSWNTSLPNYDALASVASMNIGNQLNGTLNPQDLANAQQWAAQRGVSTGTGFDSPNNTAAYQQFLGLSSQQLEQQGQTNLNAGLAAAPRTTTSAGTQTTDNNVLAAEMAASPNPYAAAMANLAAQQAGLAGGAGAAGGGGSQSGNPPMSTTAPSGAYGGGLTPGASGGGVQNRTGATQQQQQQQGAVSGVGKPMPGGNGSFQNADGSVTGANGDVWTQNSDGTWINQLTGETQSGLVGASGMSGPSQQGGIVTPSGDEWVDLGNGSYMNLTTFEVRDTPPAGEASSGGTTLDWTNQNWSGLFSSDTSNPSSGGSDMSNAFSGDVSNPNSSWWDQSGGAATTDPFSGDISDPSSSWWSD